MTDTNTLKPYANLLKGWSTKHLGDKPTADQLSAVHGLGLRPGKQAMANAMALRDGGVTGAQIVMVCGAPQLNRMRGLIADGHVKRHNLPPNAQGHTVYHVTLTAKGEARIKRNAEAQAKAALDGDKPKAKKATSKRGKGKGKPAGDAPQAAPVTDAPATAPEAVVTEAQVTN